MTFTEERFASREEWLDGRRMGIGASESPALFRVSPFKGDTEYRTWLDKTGQLEQSTTKEYEQTGLDAEPMIAAAYARKHAVEVIAPPPYSFLRSVEYPWLTASIDRFALTETGETIVMQMKCVSMYMEHHWENGLPLYVNVQVQQEMLVSGLKWAHVVVFFGSRLRVSDPYEVAFDPLFADKLIKKTRAFWKLVETRTPPALDGSGDTRAHVERRAGKLSSQVAVELPAHLAPLVARLKTAEKLREDLEADINQSHSEILSHLIQAGAVAGLVNGQPRCEVKRGKLKLLGK